MSVFAGDTAHNLPEGLCKIAHIVKAAELRDEAKMDSIELQVSAMNTAAVHMYESFGFTPESINMELRKEEE